MNKYVIDACGWIEYCNGTEAGKKVKEIIDNPKNEIVTNIVTIAELTSCFRRNNAVFEEEKKGILSRSKIFEINLEFASEAGVLHAETKQKRKNLSLSDAFVLLTARRIGGKIVTCDEDFRGMKEAIMIK
ncbi:PIN domain-containing protein [Candidatus Woesearchaeota archaeon]|nr:PIN domain-containing protein [Candidatus Woesearchaeota archaeon]